MSRGIHNLIKKDLECTKCGKVQSIQRLKNRNRGKLLKKVNVPEDQIIILVNKKYVELPAALKYEIETSGIDKKELQ